VKSIMGIPILVSLTVGVVVLADFFINQPNLVATSREFMNWGVIISAFATGLGAANLLRIHGTKLQQRRANWQYSVVLLIGLVAYAALGIATRNTSTPYQFVFTNVYNPLGATVFSFNAFFMTSAAYRAFRIKTASATVLLIAAVLVMLGNVGIGAVISDQIPVIAGWIQRVPTTAGFRGVTIGAALGAIGLSLRIILGIERSHFGGTGGGGSA
jgi:hypothetical protein